MNSAGIHQGEAYQLTGGQIIRLVIPSRGRGELLARAVGAQRRAFHWFLTPARARKWRLLFCAGWSARLKHAGTVAGWVILSPSGREMGLADAVRVAGKAQP